MFKTKTKHGIVSIGFVLLLLSQFVILTNGCGLNPIPAPNIISGSDSLFAAKNDNALFTFSGNDQNYGSFQLIAYVSTASLTTPQGGGIQKNTGSLNTAPETGYTPSEVCAFGYYWLITDVAPHYAKISIHSITQDQNGITIEFNWWVQTQAGDRSF